MNWILLAVIVILVIWIIASYNTLISQKNQTLNGWKQIDVQLKRRYDLIPNLVESVKGEMKFEQETLTKVIEARNQAISVQGQGVAQIAAQENALSGALRQLFALVENYPQLKANESVTKLMEELTSTENRIGFARQFYNDIATKYNITLQSFPTNTIAGTFGFKNAELFEITNPQEREAPKVSLDLN